MRPLDEAEPQALAGVRYVLCDLDDTLTLHGKLPSVAYAALERLSAADIAVVVVTGRPAGWCDLIARLWPVAAVVGENGALAFRLDPVAGRLLRRYQRSAAERDEDRARLRAICSELFQRYPAITLASDQDYRISDIAIDICEEIVPPLTESTVADICAFLRAKGVTAKVSSIHINAWMGSFDKVGMSLALLTEDFGLPLTALDGAVVYVGDSPNDEPMFARFPLSVGVANIRRFLPSLASPPRWITPSEGGYGFVELAERLLARRG
jgi:HAD superfamily hydrolase (TIGR01484 family)